MENGPHEGRTGTYSCRRPTAVVRQPKDSYSCVLAVPSGALRVSMTSKRKSAAMLEKSTTGPAKKRTMFPKALAPSLLQVRT